MLEKVGYPQINVPMDTVIPQFIQQFVVGHCIEGLTKIKYCDIHLEFTVKHRHQIMQCDEELRLTWVTTANSMLWRWHNVQVVPDVMAYHMFQEFATHTCPGYWTVAGRQHVGLLSWIWVTCLRFSNPLGVHPRLETAQRVVLALELSLLLVLGGLGWGCYLPRGFVNFNTLATAAKVIVERMTCD